MGSTGATTRSCAPLKPLRRVGDPQSENPRSGFPRRIAVARYADASPDPGPSAAAASLAPLAVDGEEEDAALQRAEFLSREEVLRRRLRRVRQLAKYYRGQYWGLMEAVRVRHRDYYWNFGRSPTKGEDRGGQGEGGDERGLGMLTAAMEGSGESGRVGMGFGAGESGMSRKKDKDRCAFAGCKAKPMALTLYCHLHILSDQNQRLYKACTYPIKSVHTGLITCGKPVFIAEPLSYCPTHIQKAHKSVTQALRKAGLSQTSSKPPPKINVVVAECIRQIQSKRREAQKAMKKETDDEVETTVQVTG